MRWANIWRLCTEQKCLQGFGKATWTKETNCKAEAYFWNVCIPGQEWKTGCRRNGNYFLVKNLPSASSIQSTLRYILIVSSLLRLDLRRSFSFSKVNLNFYLTLHTTRPSHHICFNFCNNIRLPIVIMKLSFRSKYFSIKKHANYSAATIYAYQQTGYRP